MTHFKHTHLCRPSLIVCFLSLLLDKYMKPLLILKICDKLIICVHVHVHVDLHICVFKKDECMLVVIRILDLSLHVPTRPICHLPDRHTHMHLVNFSHCYQCGLIQDNFNVLVQTEMDIIQDD